ncbi:MAG TPA: transcription antitermination factor NusB [Bacilli bacterium]|nr:transcription antitermination factor NusB [Bacilli bacterium]
MEKSRNQNQIDALSVIYSILTYKAIDFPIDLEELISGICNQPYSDVDFFVKEMAIKSIKHYKEISEEVDQHLNKWRWSRLNLVAQAIFLLSIAHYRYGSESVEKIVVISVAINLAKKFLDDGDYRYINAVLEKVLS